MAYVAHIYSHTVIIYGCRFGRLTDFEKYREGVAADIEETVTMANCQHVIFAGIGLSIRYFGTPNWDGLLETFVEDCDEKSRTTPAVMLIQPTPPISILGADLLHEFHPELPSVAEDRTISPSDWTSWTPFS